MPADDLALLIGAAQEAGKIALGYWKQSPKVWDKGGDEGPVTEADLAVNAMLESRLRAARPGYGWLSEESADTPARRDCEHVFMIDPIDGTRAFIAGETTFSHALAVVRNGVVTAAAVCVPARDLMFAATLDGAALCNGRPISVSDRAGIMGANILTPKTNMAAEHWIGPVPDITRSFRASVAYRLCLVAQGAFDGMLSLRQAWEWDIAAGALIAERAGAIVTDRTGAALRFNAEIPRSNGVLAAPPGLHAELLARLSPG